MQKANKTLKKAAFLLLAAVMLLATVQGAAAATLVQYYDTGDDASAYIDGVTANRAAAAQYVTANFTDTIKQIDFLTGASTGTPGTYTVKIMTNSSAAYPQVNASTFCTITTVNASGWNTCYNATGYNVTSGDKFYVSIWANSANSANYITWRYKNGGLGAGKWFSWKASAWTSYEGYSFMWRLYTESATPVYSNNTYTVNVNDLFDDSDLSGANVTLYNASGVAYTALSDASGNAQYSINATGAPASYSFNVTKTNYFSVLGGTVAANVTQTANLSQAIWTNLTVTSVVTNATVAMPANLTVGGGKTYTLTGAATNIYLRTGAMNLTWSKSGWHNLTFSENITAGANTTGTASGAFDDLFTVTAKNTSGSAITNSTVMNLSLSSPAYADTCTTTNGSCYFHLLQGYNYSISVQPVGYEYKDDTLEALTMYDSLNTSHYTTNSISFTFLDEETYAVITPTTVYLELISDVHSENRTTTTGTDYVDLLSPATYNIRYVAAGYAYRFYTITIEDNYHYDLNLTLLNESAASNITITVYDTYGDVVENATIRVLKYDVLTNTFILNQVLLTNFEGETIASMMLNSEYYIFYIEYDGVTVYTTSPTYIYSTTLSFYINIDENFYGGYGTTSNFEGNLSHSYSTNMTTYTYNDKNGLASGGCVYVYTYPELSLYNSSCGATASGTIYVGMSGASSATYLLKGKITSGGQNYTVSTLTVSYAEDAPTGTLGVFLGVFIFILLIFIAYYSLSVALFLGGLAPILLKAAGLISLGYAFSVPLFLVALIIIYLIEANR